MTTKLEDILQQEIEIIETFKLFSEKLEKLKVMGFDSFTIDSLESSLNSLLRRKIELEYNKGNFDKVLMLNSAALKLGLEFNILETLKREILLKEVKNKFTQKKETLNQEVKVIVGPNSRNDIIQEVLKKDKTVLRPSITYLDTYYPSWYKEMTLHIKEFNRMIYDFKDGIDNPFLNHDICKLIKKEIHPLDSDVMFCVIPASTNKKNKTRFYKFSKIISKELGVINGFDAIKVAKDREQSKGVKEKDVLSALRFDASKIRNKDIILFDDVITHGTSFKQLRDKLKSLGARNVCGVFIGVTYGTKAYNQIYNNRTI